MSSIWINSLDYKNSFDRLANDIETDVCIIGAGIFGLTAAYYLSKIGYKVVVIDRGEVARKTTANTTAKITSQHGLIYKYLIDSQGKELAKQYLDANEEAIRNIKKIIDDEKIDCDFEFQDSYVYTTDSKEIGKIRLENESVNSLGFKSELVTDTELPFEILGAIKFPNQAQFNPLKYVDGLVKSIFNNSGEIYTNTIVYDVDEKDGKLVTYTKYNKVKSKYVVIASHYPFVNKLGYYFLKMYQSTSYVIAADIGDKSFNGMYINTTDPIFSYRFADFYGKRILLVGGADHKTGANIDLLNAYQILENEVKKYYPKAKILYRWNTEDCITLDKIPYIGEFSNFMNNVFVGTGFNKWGMTSSNVAANIIKDKIIGFKNSYEDVFKSTRLHPVKNGAEFGNMIKESANSLVLNKFKIPEEDIRQIKNGEGKVLEYDDDKIGVYKDESGKAHVVKPICTHLGCLLNWNNLDKTWDCPCHGSRFDYTGKNLYDPAIKDLENYTF